MSGSVFDPLYEAVAHAIVGIHTGLKPIFGETNGYGWALSIVLLTVAMRLVLFPLFVKQIKSQRQMQLMQPKMKEIREKYKNDKQKMQEEMIALQREHGNPLLGCMPILLQIPLFIALFRTLEAFHPRLQNSGEFKGKYIFVAGHGLSQHTVATIGNARIFGVPLSAAFRTKSAELNFFIPPVDGWLVKLVAGGMIAIMCATIYGTQKQIIGRSGPVTDPSQRAQQRIMLYLSPFMLLISGLLFPIGVLTYWVTTNLWSMGQQFFVLKKMPAPGTPEAKAKAVAAGTDVVAPSARVQQVRLAKAADDGGSSLPEAGPRTSPPPGGPRRPTGGRPQQRGRSKGNNRKGGRR